MVLTFRPVTAYGLQLMEFIGPTHAELLDCIFTLFEPDTKARKKMHQDRFPGPDPIPVMRKHFGQLTTGYWISDKTDGTRMLMAICTLHCKKLVVLMDRRMRLFNVAPMELPEDTYKGTLLDGELIPCRQGHGTQYLVFDAMAANGASLIKEAVLVDRLAYAADTLTCAVNPQQHLLEIRWKKLFPLHDIRDFLTHLQKATDVYDTDGAILTPGNFIIRPGTVCNIFKFKEAEANTVDFVVRSGYFNVTATRGKNLIRVCKAESTADVPVSEDDIVECKLVGGIWIPVRIRLDKNRPNTNDTYQKTLEVIKENLTFADLVVTFGAH